MNTKEIENLLKENLPCKYVFVKEKQNSFLNCPYIAIGIAKSDYLINWVQWQFVEYTSLQLENGKLSFQIYWWSGGRRIYRKPNKNNENEKYLALWCEMMPAIRIKDLKKSLLKVCKDYMEIVEKIQKMELSQY